MNKIGGLYQVKQHYWLLFPNKEVASHSLASHVEYEVHAALVTAHWCNEYNYNVPYFSPNDIVALLEVDGKYKKLLTSNGEMGWTWIGEHYDDCFEEITSP